MTQTIKGGILFLFLSPKLLLDYLRATCDSLELNGESINNTLTCCWEAPHTQQTADIDDARPELMHLLPVLCLYVSYC